jgi:hypothetical protein
MKSKASEIIPCSLDEAEVLEKHTISIFSG